MEDSLLQRDMRTFPLPSQGRHVAPPTKRKKKDSEKNLGTSVCNSAMLQGHITTLLKNGGLHPIREKCLRKDSDFPILQYYKYCCRHNSFPIDIDYVISTMLQQKVKKKSHGAYISISNAF